MHSVQNHFLDVVCGSGGKMKKKRIGISFFWGASYHNIWSNGAGQNMYFLAETLKQIPDVEDVYLVFWGNDIKTLPKELEVDKMGIGIYDYKEVLDTTDVLIEGTLTVTPDIEQAFRAEGAKVVSFRMGNDFLWDQEKFIYNINDGTGRSFNGTRYDAIWAIPQLMHSNKWYLEIMTGAPVLEVPHLWNSFFLDRSIKFFKKTEKEYHTFEYQPSEGGKRVSIMEPNTSLCKTCYTPILITEAAYQREKDAIKHLYICNTLERREGQAFREFIGRTKMIKDGVLSVETRHLTPYFLGRYTDIMVSYQWELGLNYIYYEALYGNYPLVHNSPFLRDANVGYYYEEFDAYQGADQLLEAVHNHDKNLEDYKKRSQAFLETLEPTNPNNVKAYKAVLAQLFS